MPVDLPPAAVAPVVVSAARLPPLRGEAAFSVVRLDEAELAGAVRIDEALSRTPGVSLFRRTSSLSANPTTQGISLRAIAPSGAGRTLVLLDGAPLNDPFGGWVIWSQLAPEGVAGADIVRGAGAGPYGAGALTGVISLRERDAGTVADLSTGTFGTARASGAGAVQIGQVRLMASGAYDRGDGYTPVRGRARGAADTPVDLDARSAALRLDAPVGEAELSVRLGGYSEDRGAGLNGARAKATGSALSATLARTPSETGWGWRLQAWRRDSDLANSAVAVAANRATTTPANDQYETPATGQGVNAALRWSGPRFEGEFGLDARFADGEVRERFRYMAGAFTRDRRAGGETSVAGAYAEGAVTQDQWLLAGGLRLDRWTSSNGLRIERDAANGAVLLDDRPADRDGQVATARLGARRDLGQGGALRLAAYSGFRPPTLNELHRPFRVGNDITEANSALRPERLLGLETGVSARGQDYLLEATAFWNRIEDPIANVTLGAGPAVFPRAGFVPAGGVLRERRNTGEITAIGLEAHATRKLGAALDVRAALSVTDARVDGGAAAPQLTGKRPAQAPIWSATTGMQWRVSSRLDLDVDLTWEGKRFDDDLNSRVLGASLRIDARADWRLARGVTAYLAADNLLDEEIEVSRTANGVAGYANPRMARIGLRLAFD
ncbi:MAG: TonB-dependent receptor [Caulobacter sp. 35-67-4]|nr:MAG: TonB-dependent receptor [Caulobacter sp. 32-67-35]OYX94352.1 MAG: TonB-dependent receptor [Caulobacter sp. 35-67-4]